MQPDGQSEVQCQVVLELQLRRERELQLLHLLEVSQANRRQRLVHLYRVSAGNQHQVHPPRRVSSVNQRQRLRRPQ